MPTVPTDEIQLKDFRLHLGFVDSLRGLAALYVLLCHAYYEPNLGYYREWILNRLLLSYFHLAVDLFIVISGFCLTWSLAKHNFDIENIWAFYKRRLTRIYPPYFLMISIASIFILITSNQQTGTLWDVSLPLTPYILLRNITITQSIPLPDTVQSLSHQLWSIPVEMLTYAFMPLIMVLLKKFGNYATLLVTLAIGIGSWRFFPDLNGLRPWYLVLFTLGCIAAKECYQRQGKAPKYLNFFTVLLIIVNFTVMFKMGNKFFRANEILYDIPFGLAFALLLIVVMSDLKEARSPLTRFLCWKPLVKLGVFSYSIYLVHAVLLHLFWIIGKRAFHFSPPQMFLYLVLLSPVMVAIAYLFHLVAEKPFMSVKKSRPGI